MTNKDNPNEGLIPSLPSNQDGARKEVGGADLHAPTASGTMIQVIEEGKFKEVNPLINKYVNARKRLETVLGKLEAFKSTEHLNEYAKHCVDRGLDPRSELERLAKELEKQKIECQEKLAKWKHRITQKGLCQGLDTGSLNPAAPLSLVPTREVERNRRITERNDLIFANQTLSTLEICKRLDARFGRDISLVLPEGWTEKYGVKTFVQAFRDRRCRPLVDPLISKARKLTA